MLLIHEMMLYALAMSVGALHFNILTVSNLASRLLL